MNGYPLHGYLYTADGFHGPPTVLTTQEELHLFLGVSGRLALQQGRELLVVSGDDEDCFFHIKDGHVLYASGVDPAATEEHMRRLFAWSPRQDDTPLCHAGH